VSLSVDLVHPSTSHERLLMVLWHLAGFYCSLECYSTVQYRYFARRAAAAWRGDGASSRSGEAVKLSNNEIELSLIVAIAI